MKLMQVLLSGAMVLGTMALGNCGGGDDKAGGGGSAGSGGGGRISVYLLPKNKGNPYFETCNEGAEEAAKELGNIDLVFDGPPPSASGTAAAEEAASLVDRWTSKHATVIAVSASEPKILGSAMAAAQRKGVKTITWDADTAQETRTLFVCQASAEQIGNALVDTLARDIGDGNPDNAQGDVAIVTAQLTAANQNEWIKYITIRLEKYPKLHLIATEPSDDDPSKAQQVTRTLITSKPNLKGIFAISSQAFPAAAEAIKQEGKAGKIQITGLATPMGMKDHVLAGTVKSVVLWDTHDLGYLTIYTAEAVASGKYKPGDKKISAGRLGEKDIVDGKVMLGPIMVFTKENIEKYKF